MPKTLLITGASSDIGQNLVERVADNYDVVIAHYAHTAAPLLELQHRLGDKLVLVCADFTIEQEVRSMTEEILARGLCPEHIVHLPALKFDMLKFNKIKWEAFSSALEVGFKSAVLIFQAFVPHMAKQQYGKLVIMLTKNVDGAAPKYCAQYVCAKYALLGLTKALASEYADKNICVNAVSPAVVDTKFLAEQPRFFTQELISHLPIDRPLCISEVTAAIEFLLSPGADRISGQNLVIANGA